MKNFWLCFVPLFVAVDAIGVLPIFISLVSELEKKRIFRIIVQSFLTAMVVSLLFLFLGKFVFNYLGITTYDFMIAGGTILFIISVRDILSSEKKQRQVEPDSLGAVPIGVPLIAGPAVITTLLILGNEYGYFIPLLALVINIFLACGLFLLSSPIIKLFGKAGTKALSKIFSLILASIAIMMIRKGISALFITF